MRARRHLFALSALAIAAVVFAATLDAHDLFLRPRDFVVKAGGTVQVRVLNGGYTSSEAVVAADRLRDLTLVGPDGLRHPDRSDWTSAGKESAWRVSLGRPGTWLLGASLSPKTIRLTGKQFDGYLREEGLTDLADARRKAGIAATPAHERYSKHVKSLVRATGSLAAGDTAYRTVLGYPAELVPLADPYTLAPRATLPVRALLDGKPAAQEVVISGGRTAGGKVIAERRTRTGADGLANIVLSQRGTWYVKFIHMVPIPASAGDSVTHESRWATLTFALP